jgi:hypothetical protein
MKVRTPAQMLRTTMKTKAQMMAVTGERSK